MSEKFSVVVILIGMAAGFCLSMVAQWKVEDRIQEQLQVKTNQQQLINAVNQLGARLQKLEQPVLPEASE